jgi:hypothetical protein
MKRKLKGGVSHETVRQYLKVHEGAPEAGVARETTTVKKVAKFDTLLTKKVKFSELFDKGQTMGEQTSVQSKTNMLFVGRICVWAGVMNNRPQPFLIM